MNILVSVNKKYLDKIMTTLFSLSNHVKCDVDVYLMNRSLSKNDIDKLKSYLKNKCNFNLFEINVENNPLDNLPVYYHMSIETYYRLLAQFLLPKNLDRVLWLDADIIILKNIDDFYFQDFENKSLIACTDIKFESERIKEIKEKVGIPIEHKYFNAGVILFNLEKLRKETTENEIVNICNYLQPKVILMDQDILNYFYSFNVKYDDMNKYNFQVVDRENIYPNELENIHILHYSSGKKPWNYQWINKTSKYYWDTKIKQGHFLKYYKVMILSFIFKSLRKVKRMIFNKKGE